MYKYCKFFSNKKGIVAIEYALIALMIAITILYTFSSESGFILELTKKFNLLTETLTNLTK